MDRSDLMMRLDVALADVASLLETSLAVADEARSSSLRGGDQERSVIRRELGEAADAYLSVLLSSESGELKEERVAKCRADAAAPMPKAVSMQSDLAHLVSSGRQPLVRRQNDLTQLALLSLELRESVKGLSAAASFDSKVAEPAANKMLVHLQSTLAYLLAARSDSQNRDDTTKPRAAALTELKKAKQHVAGLQTLEERSAERAGTMVAPSGAVMHAGAGPLRKLLQEWSTQSNE